MCLRVVHEQQRIQSYSVLIFINNSDLVVVATVPVFYYRGTRLILLSGFSGDTRCVDLKTAHFH